MKNINKGVIYKMYIKKGYDHINWDFVMIVLEKMGSGQKWIKWIKWCISSAKFSILVNKTPSGFFQISKGLKQGDPLSFYFLILAIEALSAIL